MDDWIVGAERSAQHGAKRDNREKATGETHVETEQTYEIFKKQADNTTVRVEAVKGIEEAQKRVGELNAESASEEYFVFDPSQAAVIEPSAPAVAIDPFAP